MPPLATRRASKACDLCRKNKTRCHASDKPDGSCLRCETLAQSCSLKVTTSAFSRESRRHRFVSPNTSRGSEFGQASPRVRRESDAVNQRLERLERSVQGLADRLDARLDDIPQVQSRTSREKLRSRMDGKTVVAERNPAPVLLLRDAAADAGVGSPQPTSNQFASPPDVITTGIVSLSTAQSLLRLFRVHYGRWVRFPEHVSVEALLGEVRKSPLLLSSVCLIAVRHTTQDLADTLAPTLFEEAKSLLQSSLLTAPQPLHFFQAVLILSLWSTTIGQVLLSVDSWLLTGYALQQALASPEFEAVLQTGSETPRGEPKTDTWCIWNHLCVAHLQYCVGTRRQSLLNETQVESCVSLLEHKDVDNFEARMAAEVRLYWIMVKKCSASEVDLVDTEAALEDWYQEWSELFSQPRSQFLQMGYEFAYLITYHQSVKSLREVMGGSVLEEMIRRCQNIINLVVGTADGRTPHLTDHIYLVVAFAALTLCRLVHTYETQLQQAKHDIVAMDAIVIKLVKWLKTIGLPCHVAPLLGRIVFAQFKKLRPDGNTQELFGSHDSLDFDVSGSLADLEDMPTDPAFPYPDLNGSELFYMANGLSWPQWC